jgi:hypothetical protein
MLTLVGCAVVLAQAPESNLLKEAKDRAEIASQRVEAQIRTAVVEAQRDRPRAAELLRGALALLENDTALTPARRASLQRMLTDRLREAETNGVRAEAAAADQRDRRYVVIGRRADEAQKSVDRNEINQTLEQIAKLQQIGRVEEANRLAVDLAKRHPDLTAAQTSGRTAASLNQALTERRYRADREAGFSTVNRDVFRASVPPAGDIEFSKDWAEKSKLRLKGIVTVTAKEKTILQSLNTPVTVNFKNTRFEDAIEYLSTLIGQPIILDKQALDDAQVTYDTPVSVNLKGVSARSLLRKILGDAGGLTYVIKEEAIQVTSAEKAKNSMVTRAYYLGDAVVGLGAGSFVFGPGIDQLQTLENAARIAEMIKTSIDPQSWQENGGSGTIRFDFATLSLIVKQSAEVHSMLGNSLYK